MQQLTIHNARIGNVIINILHPEWGEWLMSKDRNGWVITAPQGSRMLNEGEFGDWQVEEEVSLLIQHTAAPSPLLSYDQTGRAKAKELQEMYGMTVQDTGRSDTVIIRHLKDVDGNLWTEIESQLPPPAYYYKFYCTKAARAFTCTPKEDSHD